MEDVHRSLLKRVSFRKDLEPMKCMPYLIQDNILDENDEQQIKVQPTRTDQVDKMLDILPRRGPHAFRCLVDALKKVQPHLADLLLEGEEMEKKLSMERCNSARLGDRLREARDKLEQLELEKNKLENIRKELEECLHQVENEKEKMISNINELNKMKERLTKDLDEEKKEKLSLQSRYVDLKEVLQSQSKVIERLEASFQRNDASSSSKVSADELGSQEKPHLSGRPTSARSQHNPKERVNVEYVRYLMAYRDYAKTCVKRYEKQLKIFEEKQMSKIDKATTMDDTGLNTCSKCTVHESEYNELQQAKEKIECSLKEMTDKYERENKHLESSLQCNEMLRNEMSALTAKHKSDMEDKEIALKYKLVEKSKVTIRHLRRVLTRERQKYKKINKRFNKYKKKTKSKNKKLEDDIKSKALRLEVLEAELKEAKDHEHNKGLEDMTKSTATLNGQQDTQEEHENEELRQKKLEDDIKSKALRLKDTEAELKEAKDHEHNQGLEDMNKSKATLKGQQDTQEEHENEELTRQKKLEDDIKSKVLRSEVLEAELKEAKDHEHNQGLEDMKKSTATLNGQQDTQEEHKNEELTRQKNLPGKRALSAFHGSDLALQSMRLSLLPNKN